MAEPDEQVNIDKQESPKDLKLEIRERFAVWSATSRLDEDVDYEPITSRLTHNVKPFEVHTTSSRLEFWLLENAIHEFTHKYPTKTGFYLISSASSYPAREHRHKGDNPPLIIYMRGVYWKIGNAPENVGPVVTLIVFKLVPLDDHRLEVHLEIHKDCEESATLMLSLNELLAKIGARWPESGLPAIRTEHHDVYKVTVPYAKTTGMQIRFANYGQLAGRPRNPTDEWARVQVQIQNRPPNQVYREWKVRTEEDPEHPQRVASLANSKQSFDKLIQVPHKQKLRRNKKE